MNGYDVGIDYTDAADIGTVLPPAWMTASPETEAETGGAFFGDLWKGIGEFTGGVAKAAAPILGSALGVYAGRELVGGPQFGPGQPAIVGQRTPVGYPGIRSGGAGAGFIPMGSAPPPSGSLLGSILNNPMSLAAVVLGLVVFVLMVRR